MMDILQTKSHLRSLLVAVTAISAVLSGGCARLYHLMHYNCVSRSVHDHHLTYYHSPDTGRIIPKEHRAQCQVEFPCFGFESTCWHRWPAECINCPIEELTDAHGAIQGEIIAPVTPAIPDAAIESSPQPSPDPSVPEFQDPAAPLIQPEVGAPPVDLPPDDTTGSIPAPQTLTIDEPVPSTAIDAGLPETNATEAADAIPSASIGPTSVALPDPTHVVPARIATPLASATVSAPTVVAAPPAVASPAVITNDRRAAPTVDIPATENRSSRRKPSVSVVTAPAKTVQQQVLQQPVQAPAPVVQPTAKQTIPRFKITAVLPGSSREAKTRFVNDANSVTQPTTPEVAMRVHINPATSIRFLQDRAVKSPSPATPRTAVRPSDTTSSSIKFR